MFGFKSKKSTEVSKEEVLRTITTETTGTANADTVTYGKSETVNSIPSSEAISPVETIEREPAHQIPTITRKEVKHLKRARYNEIKDKFSKSFVLLNEKTGQIVEINAASSFHAANIIGWKSRSVRVLEVKENAQPKV